MSNEVKLEDLQALLTKQTEEINKKIPELVKKESDNANKEIGELKTALQDVTKGLDTLKESIKERSSFGMPGVEHETYKGGKNWNKKNH